MAGENLSRASKWATAGRPGADRAPANFSAEFKPSLCQQRSARQRLLVFPRPPAEHAYSKQKQTHFDDNQASLLAPLVRGKLPAVPFLSRDRLLKSRSRMCLKRCANMV